MSSNSPLKTPVQESLGVRGERIYEETLRAKLEPGNDGKFLLIHPDTGDYELDEDEMAATLRSMERHPGGRWYMLRIGYPAAAFFGGVRRTLP